MNEKITFLYEAIEAVVEQRLENIHTCLPARIEKYDYSVGKADVKPLIKKKFRDGDVVSLPVIPSVPVSWPRTKTAVLHFPLVKGDTGIVVFSERSLEIWLSKGGDVLPGDPRKFDLTDAVFIPGIVPFNVDNLADNNDDVILQYKNTGIRIKKNGDVEIGETSFKRLINEEFKSLFDGHQHNFMGFLGTGTPTPGMTTGPVSITGTLPPPVPLAPAGTILPGTEISNLQMTSKVTAQ